MALEGEDGTVRVLWLTRRLLLRLLPSLLDAFSDTGDTPRATARHQAKQSFNQQAAVSSIQRQKPVRAATAEILREPDILVWGVDIKKQPRQMVLVFKSQNAEQTQAIPYAVPALRQWLSVLHKQFQAAAWSVDFWPAWMSQEEATAATPKLN